ncbi:MAG: hypothetical protein A2008_00875 [Candidatus Wallbacteria bacterium GWC2_49_35]|uniref:Uncharacterized protein n=1 Tax=Candidatus Wallbacteria bacterium GWC2_49_35 TaxID=1817813 RepID=A0A1F7WPY7_9BACT|nr:MAG: hypothetical protein A2008_00875 [Candidatus Wallbacteria bacterium GWC2_49_35]HBC75209.1 hypothetical protein [Candidatus Wallbacteria bacterium]
MKINSNKTAGSGYDNLKSSKRQARCILTILFCLAIFAFLHGFAGTASADIEDFSDLLKAVGAGGYIEEYPTCFFPPAHAPAASLKDEPKSLAAVIMPLIYFVNEKYPLYPEDTNKKAGNENFSKYIPKIVNLSGSVRLKTVLDHLSSPLSFCGLDLLPNLTFAWYQNFYISSIIKQDSFPAAVTLIDGGLNAENALIYYYINTNEYSIYLIYSPFAAPAGNADMVRKTLAYNKFEMKFHIIYLDAKTGAHRSSDPVAAIFIHDLKEMLSKFDRFKKIKAGEKMSFSTAYNYLKMQIEKKIIKDDARLASYRYYHFLSPEKRGRLARLIKSVKTDILEPELATYSSRFADIRPLQAEMAEKNKNEQQRAILKKFSLLNEKIQKMNIKLTPKREYDLIFKKLNINNN